MATIQTRKRKKGAAYTVTIRKKGESVTATFSRLTDARLWAAQTEAAMHNKRHGLPVHVNLTLKDALRRYLDTVSINKKKNTRRVENDCANALIREFPATIQLSSITSAMVASFRDRRLRQVSAYTVRLELILLAHLYKIAGKEWGINIENPVSNVARPKVPAGRTIFLTDKESKRLLNACAKSKNKLLYPFVLTLLHTAMRSGECASLKVNQVDIKNRFFYLKETKNGKPRKPPMTRSVRDILKKIIKDKAQDDYVFIAKSRMKDIDILPALYFRQAFTMARKKAKLEHIHMHDLRHTAASHLLMSGCDLRTLADILGHSGLQMVQRYTHLLDGFKRAAVDKINELGI